MVAQPVVASGLSQIRENHVFERRNPATGGSVSVCFAVVPVDLLLTDAYQRPIAKAKVAQIAANFDDTAAGALLVNEREDGLLFVFDGQQRLGAMREIGRTSALCLVYRGLTRQQEAEAFEHCNNVRTHVAANDRFRSRMVRQEANALGILDLVHDLGLELQVEFEQQRSGLRCVEALDSVTNRYGLDMLRTVLRVCRTAWSDVPQERYTSVVVRAVTQICVEAQGAGITPDDLIRRLKRTSIERESERASALARALGYSRVTGLTEALRLVVGLPARAIRRGGATEAQAQEPPETKA